MEGAVENKLRENLHRCLKCGLCREVCPVFRVTGEERLAPRGRMAMLAALDDGPDLGPAFLESLDLCLSCKACTERCPSGVAAELQVLAARASGHCRGGMPILKGWAFQISLGRPRLMAFLIRAVKLTQELGLFHERNPLRILLPILGLSPYLPIGGLKEKNLDEVWNVPDSQFKGDVFYFSGCASRFLYPELGEAMKRLIVAAGYRPILPEDRVCCGIPALVNGDWEQVRPLAAKNIAALAGDAPVVVDCGSCGVMLKEYYPEVLNIPGSDDIVSRVMDISEFLLSVGYTELFKTGEPVAYHDPCHLARGMDVKGQPRELLEATGGLEELAEVGACCGGAGTYGATHPEVFSGISERKAGALAEADADIVATGCPACVYYLRSTAENSGIGKKVEHTAIVLAERIKKRG
ncbi:MAG: (Fe-S)-binding protein [bacterium]|nr:(Fe-S)-binding protein [bacterium]